MADYSGSFFGSFQGTISGSLLGSGIVSGSTQIAALGVGIVSGSTQIDFNSIVNKPTTIQPFQANSITSNNQFRQVTYPAISASTSTRFTTIENNASTLSTQTTTVSASVSTRITALTGDVTTLQGQTTTISASTSTRLTTAEANVTTLQSQIQAVVAGSSSADWNLITNIPAGLVSSSTQILEFGYILSSQTSSFVLSSQTSSMNVLSALTASFISDVFISASALRSGFGSGTTTDISALNTFTGSAQTNLNALNSATSSYLTSANTSSFILVSQTSSMSVLSALTASFISSTFISASVVASGFGSGGGLTISGSTPSGDQINKVFSNLQFDSSTGLNVTESISGTAFVSIGSHFRDIIVNGSATLVATGSDSLEIIAGDGIQIFTSLSDTNGDGISKELEFRLDTSSQHFTNAVTNIALVSGSNISQLFNDGVYLRTIGDGVISSSAQLTTEFDTRYLNTAGDNVLSSSAQIANEITGAFTATSGGLSTRITTLEGAGGTTFSSSVSTRLTSVEGYTLDNITDNGSSTTNVITVGGLTVNGNATITGTLTAQQFNTEFVSSSIIFESGSTKFGDSIDDIHSFTGSVKLNTQTAATTDTDKFLVFDTGGEIKYRTGAEILGDINPGGLVSSSAQLTTEFDTRYLNTAGDNVLSSSAQIASDISGAFTEVSGGLAVRITTLEETSGDSVIALNLFTSSIQTQVNNLTQQTSSYILVSQTSSMNVLSALTASFISDVFISASALRSGFGSGTTTDISALNTFTGSIQTQVNNLNLATSSFVTNSQTSSMSVLSALTASFIGNLNYNFITNLPNLISSSTQIALLGAGLLSSSAQIATEISGAFTSLSASFAARLDLLNVGGGIFQLTGSSYNTTNNIQITGSLSVGSGSFKAFEVSSDGFVVLGDMDKDLNNAPEGTIAYSGSNFYLIS